VTDKKLHDTNVIGQFLGEGQRVAHQTGHALSQRIIEASDMIGFASLLRDGTVPLRRNHPFVHGILIGMECGGMLIDLRDIGLERLATVATPIPHMTRHDLAGGRIHGNPEPLPVGLFLHEAPHRIGFRFQLRQHYGCRLGGALGMQVLGTGRKAFHHKVPKPCETHADGTADSTEGETLTEQVGNLHALLRYNAPVQGIRSALAATRFTLMILPPMARMAILLVPVRSAC
jgi:hypothetical protein